MTSVATDNSNVFFFKLRSSALLHALVNPSMRNKQLFSRVVCVSVFGTSVRPFVMSCGKRAQLPSALRYLEVKFPQASRNQMNSASYPASSYCL